MITEEVLGGTEAVLWVLGCSGALGVFRTWKTSYSFIERKKSRV